MKAIVFLGYFFFLSSCSGQPSGCSLPEELRKKITNNTYPKIDAILVEKNNTIIVEEYFNGFTKDSPHDLRSSFKSIASILTGIAIDQQLFQVTDSIGRFFPELKDERKKRIRVQDLLEMRSGLNCEEFYEIGPECETEMMNSKDWVAFCLGVDMIREPGMNWSYNSNEPMLVGEIIARASGMSVMDFAKKYLFQPMGIEQYKWTVSPTGSGMTAGSFYMKPNDFLKIINLVKQKGNWKGKQLVSESWIEKSTNCTINIDFSFTRYSKIPNARYESARYGFFWYQENLQYGKIKTEVLFSSGNGGQYMMYLPDYKTTVVFTGSNFGNWRGKLPFEILLKYIIPILM